MVVQQLVPGTKTGSFTLNGKPKQGVRCILRTAAPPQIVCPGLGLLVVHVAAPFRLNSGMQVGEGMEDHGIKCGGFLDTFWVLYWYVSGVLFLVHSG